VHRVGFYYTDVSRCTVNKTLNCFSCRSTDRIVDCMQYFYLLCAYEGCHGRRGSGVSTPYGRPFLRIQPAVAGELPVISEAVTMCRPIPSLETCVVTTANTKHCVSGCRYCDVVPDAGIALQQHRQCASRRWQASASYSGTALCALRVSNVQTHKVIL